MKALTCPECKKGNLIEKKDDYETLYVDRDGRSQPLRVAGVAWLECDSCGEAVLDDRAMSIIEAARRTALGLLSPQEIRAFRLRLRKTQAAMSELLGIGEKTYCRWESGSYMQSEAFDRYLRLLIADDGNLRLLQEIANAKQAPEPVGRLGEVRVVFSYINDLRGIEERGRVFVDLMERGALYAGQ